MRAIAIVAILVLAGCATPAATRPPIDSTGALPPAIAFTGADRASAPLPTAIGSPVAIRADKDAVEPTIAVANDGSVMFVGYEDVWRTTDGGASFQKVQSIAKVNSPIRGPECILPICGPQPTTYDPWLAHDPVTDRVHVIHLADRQFLCNFHVVSDDDGATWTDLPPACPGPAVDFPKLVIAAPGPDPNADATGVKSVATFCYNKPTGAGYDGAPVTGYTGAFAVACAASYDGGMTFKNERELTHEFLVQTESRLPAACEGPPAPQAALPDGTVVLRTPPDCLFVTRDSGATWQAPLHVAPEILEASVAAGRDGTLYLYGRGPADPHASLLMRSRDKGTSWEGPWRVDPPTVGAWVYPTMVAGDAGRIALTFMGTTDKLDDAANGTDTTRWQAWIVTSDDALAATPTFVARQATPDAQPIHIGCISRVGCPFLGDFLGSALAPDGTPWAVFAGNCGAKCRAAPDDPKARIGYGIATLVHLDGWSAFNKVDSK